MLLAWEFIPFRYHKPYIEKFLNHFIYENFKNYDFVFLKRLSYNES